jgi:predicted nucleic acid-binding protein
MRPGRGNADDRRCNVNKRPGLVQIGAIEGRILPVSALETFRRRPTLGFSDCLLVELAQKAGHLPLGTFDRDLSKVDGAAKL